LLLQKKVKIILIILLLLVATRFFYGIAKNPSLWFAGVSVDNRYDSQLSPGTNTVRKYGPVFIIVMKAVKTFAQKDYIPIVWRILSILTYALIVYFVMKIILLVQNLFFQDDGRLNCYIFALLALTFSPMIYHISNGSAEVFCALSVVCHFYYFYKKKYFLASLFIIGGIYFTLFPLPFVVPYIVFSIFSKSHKNYFYSIILSTLIISLISFLFQGWRDGALYPFSMVFSIMDNTGDTRMLSIWNREVFAPLSFINKLINGFNVQNAAAMTEVTKSIAKLFVFLSIGINIFLGWLLTKFECKWKDNDKTRLFHLLFFQVIFEIIFFSFSLNIAIGHVVIGMIVFFSPLIFFSFKEYQISNKTFLELTGAGLFITGIILMGGILPVSILCKIIPLEWLHKMAGNQPGNLSLYGMYIWYHIPMFGMYTIVLSFLCYIPTMKKVRKSFVQNTSTISFNGVLSKSQDG